MKEYTKLDHLRMAATHLIAAQEIERDKFISIAMQAILAASLESGVDELEYRLDEIDNVVNLEKWRDR